MSNNELEDIADDIFMHIVLKFTIIIHSVRKRGACCECVKEWEFDRRPPVSGASPKVKVSFRLILFAIQDNWRMQNLLDKIE